MAFTRIAGFGLGLAALVMLVQSDAVASSWFGWGKKDSAPDPGSVVLAIPQNKGNQQSYKSTGPMTVVNPGGWGSPTDPAFMTKDDMRMQADAMKQQTEALAALRKKAKEEEAIRNQIALFYQNLVRSSQPAPAIAPIAPIAPAIPSQTGNAPTGTAPILAIPQSRPAPVQEWDAINRARQEAKPQGTITVTPVINGKPQH